MASKTDDELSPAEVFKRATANTVRTLSGREDLAVSFGNEAASGGAESLRIPVPAGGLKPDNRVMVRAAADSLALRLRHHNARSHRRSSPNDATARAAFETLEWARCEALGARQLAGVAENLQAALAEHCRRQGLDQVGERSQVAVGEALRLLAFESFTGRRLPDSARKAVSLWEPWLREHLGSAPLERLAGLLDDQKSYGEACRQLLRQLELDVELDREEQETEPEDSDDDDTEHGADSGEEEARSGEREQSSIEQESGEGETSTKDSPSEVSPGQDADESDSSTPWRSAFTGEEDSRRQGYKVFTARYDEVVEADALCEPEELDRLRQRLDQRLQHLQGMVSRLANRLQRHVLAQQTRDWEFDLEEGILDARRLHQVVVNPTLPLSFKQEKDMRFRDTVVSLLIDNSGSMRGWPITVAAMSSDILARILERCAVKVEILGFTTRAWKGGQPRERWLEAGKPEQPGRLNELRHIIYKSADAPWRRVRRNLGLMLQEGILKQNIDGEALAWAHQRLLVRPEQRRILMVISDGAPVDDSTLSVNSGDYLDIHLRQVIHDIETRSPVQLAAIGIGHDVARYYRRAVTIADPEQLGPTLLAKLHELFQEGRHGRGRGRAAPVRQGR